MKQLILITVLFFTNIYGDQQRIDPLVIIKQGLVKGQKATDGSYSQFFGIPYAEVDLDNPFGSAKPAPSFGEDIFYANEKTAQCPQTPFSGYARAEIRSLTESVDCLQLNVYVPSQASVQNPLPVLVWIHGGIFILGSGHEFDPITLLKHDVIVVTINYRLGAYGFMCLNSPAAPGNQGLKDQYAALEWVRENIAAFGGNPYNVTIAGQSAGSANVLLHLFSPKEKLFNQVIAQSGTPLSPDMFTNGDPEAAVKLANYLGLNTTDDDIALEFLSKAHHSLVMGASYDLKIEFKPCAEKPFTDVDIFVDNEPYSLSNEKKIRNTPIMIGNTNEEYLGDVQQMHGEDYFDKDFFSSRLQQMFNFDKDELENAANIVRHFYIGDKSISPDVNTEAVYFNSDVVFNHPIQDTISRLVSENAGPVYEYVFSYVGDSGLDGAYHSSELPFLFELDFEFGLEKPSTEDDLVLLNRMTTLWSNFIKYGNPTPETSDLLPVTWTPITQGTRQYLNINKELQMDHRFTKERMAFWDLFYSTYGRYNKFARKSDM